VKIDALQFAIVGFIAARLSTWRPSTRPRAPAARPVTACATSGLRSQEKPFCEISGLHKSYFHGRQHIDVLRA
jgi:hypothetical protein